MFMDNFCSSVDKDMKHEEDMGAVLFRSYPSDIVGADIHITSVFRDSW